MVFMNLKMMPWIAVTVLSVVLITPHAQPPTPSTLSGGSQSRFQLYTVPDTRIEYPHVYRIDIQTGETAVLKKSEMQLAGDPPNRLRYAYWQKIDEQFILHDVIAEVRNAPRR